MLQVHLTAEISVSSARLEMNGPSLNLHSTGAVSSQFSSSKCYEEVYRPTCYEDVVHVGRFTRMLRGCYEEVTRKL